MVQEDSELAASATIPEEKSKKKPSRLPKPWELGVVESSPGYEPITRTIHDQPLYDRDSGKPRIKAGAEGVLQEAKIAAKLGDINTVKKLLEEYGDLGKQQDEVGWGLIHEASKAGHAGIVALLLSRGASICMRSVNGRMPLLLAAAYGHYSVARHLLEQGADVNSRGYFHSTGKTALHEAVNSDHTTVVELLIQNNADVDKKDAEGCSPIFTAAQHGNLDIVRILAEAGARPDATSKGSTPLLEACRNGHAHVVQYLLELGCNVEHKDDQGATPLLRACRARQYKVFQVLMKTDASINVQDVNGRTPLHECVAWNVNEVVSTLLMRGAAVNVTDNRQTSPLMEAAKAGSENISRMLVMCQADLQAIDSGGRTAADLAYKWGYGGLGFWLQAPAKELQAYKSRYTIANTLKEQNPATSSQISRRKKLKSKSKMLDGLLPAHDDVG